MSELVKRDIKVKYKKSLLGILWSVLNPLLTMVVLTIVFSNIFKFDIENFPVYIITGQIIFGFFSESTSLAMTSLVQNAALIKKVYIPKYMFPVSKILSSFTNLLFSLVAMIIVMLVTGIDFSYTILFIPIALFYILMFSAGIGLIVSAYTVFFRDIEHLYGILLTMWFYMTPFIYPESILPDKYNIILTLNPLYYFVKYFREITMYGHIPSVEIHLICLGIALGTFFLGWFIFERKENEFILYI